MALTRACGAMCSFCYAMVQEPQERANIKTKEALNLLDDFKDIGVKGVLILMESIPSKGSLSHLSNMLQILVSMLVMPLMAGNGNQKK